MNHTSSIKKDSPLEMTIDEHEAHYIPIWPFQLSSECLEGSRGESMSHTSLCVGTWDFPQSLLNALTPRIIGAEPMALVQCMLGLGRWSMSVQ